MRQDLIVVGKKRTVNPGLGQCYSLMPSCHQGSGVGIACGSLETVLAEQCGTFKVDKCREAIYFFMLYPCVIKCPAPSTLSAV